MGPGGEVELEMREVLTGDGISSGSPNQTGEQSRGGRFKDELTPGAHHGGLVVRLINGRLRVRSQHEYVNRWWNIYRDVEESPARNGSPLRDGVWVPGRVKDRRKREALVTEGRVSLCDVDFPANR